MNDEIRRLGRQAAKWADTAAVAYADGNHDLAAHARNQARKFESLMRRMQSQALTNKRSKASA